MNIPFYHGIGHGLYWAEERLRWVTLRRSGRDVEVVGTWAVSIRDGDEADALARLVERVDPSVRQVATHLNPAHVRCFVAEVDPYADRESWIAGQIEDALPLNVPASDFIARTRPITGSDVDRVLIALTRRSALEKRTALLERVGLTPVMVGALRLDVAFAYAYDPRFAPGASEVLLEASGRTWRVPCIDGRMSAPPEPQAAPRLADALDDLLLTGEGARLFIAGGEGVLSPSVRNADRAVYLDARTRGTAEDDASDGVRARDVPGMALAMKQLYPDADPINFLDEDAVHAARDARDREQATQSLLAVCLLLAVLLAAATGVTMVADRWQRDLQAEQAHLDTQLQEIQAAEATRDALRERLVQSRALVRQRTHVALLLENVGRSVPDAAWLSELTVLRPAPIERPTTAAVQVRGHADDDGPVARLLSTLEGHEGIDDVRLLRSERLGAERVARQTGLERAHLNEFDIRLTYRQTP